MTNKPMAADLKKPKLLIMDRTPLSVLSSLDGALDWLFKPGCDVWITDMVLKEALRESEPGADRRRASRATFDQWFGKNRHLIRVVETEAGKDYERNMQLWIKAGRPADLVPSTVNLGERSVFDKIKTSRELLQQDEAFLVLMDDRDGREAIKLLPTNIDLMSTQTFVEWMAEDFKVKEAETAWVTLERMLGETLDPGPAVDPVYVRNFSKS